MKYHIAVHIGEQNAIFLYGECVLLGGWFDTETCDAARIASEVLKVALPNAEIVGDAAALLWWAEIKTIEKCLDEATLREIRTAGRSRLGREFGDSSSG